MKALLAKYGYLLVWTLAIVLAGAIFWSIIQANSHFSPLSSAPTPPAVNPPPAPPPPSVTFTVQKSRKGNAFRVQWANLPSGTTGLDIFRSPKGKDQWSLWKHVAIGEGEIGGGSFAINIGSSLYSNYSFYITATGSGGGGGGDGSGSGSGNTGSPVILWTSSSTVVTVTTSTPGSPPSATAGTTSTGTTPSVPSASPTSSGPAGTPPPGTTQSSTSTSGSGGGGGGATPTGTPYYTPQLQISSYGSAPSGTFWVQYLDKKIQIGWQNLPPTTASVQVFRSSNQNGPWTVVLTQTNPDINGPYSIQLVDNAVGQPYYYEMQAFAGSSVIATYGPVYLTPST